MTINSLAEANFSGMTKLALDSLKLACCDGCGKSKRHAMCFPDEAEIEWRDGEAFCPDFDPYHDDKTVDMFGGANDQ